MTIPAAGAVIAGKFVLERPLARGGMGAVWVGRHRELGVAVAVKFMDQSLIADDDARIRFEREAKAAATLETKHVVQVLDYGVDAGAPYIVMELLRGEDLATRLSRDRQMSLTTAAGILGQVAKGLRKAHEAGLVHRDLKPANIFLAQKDDEEVVKIVDFGIAKATGTGLAGQATASGVVIGSVHYMSPEQVRHSRTVDARSDLWSLGVIAFRMVTGRLPFQGQEVGDVLVKVCADPIPVASQVAPGLPPAVDAFFARALARPMEERFQSAGEMAEAFAAVAGVPLALHYTGGSLPDIGPVSAYVPVQAPVIMDPTMGVQTQVWKPAQSAPVPVEPASGVGTLGTLRPSQGTVRQPAVSAASGRAWIGVLTGGAVIAAIGAVAFMVRRAPPAPDTSPVVAAAPSAKEAAASALPAVTEVPAAAPPAPLVTGAPEATAAPSAEPALPAASAVASAAAPPLVSAKPRAGTAPSARPATTSVRPVSPPKRVEKKIDLP